MPLNIQSTAGQGMDKLNVLIYGPPGSGKTRFIGSAAKRFKTMIASAESGLLSLKNLKDEQGNKIACDYQKIENWEELEELTRYMMVGAGKDKYQCFAIDSGTEIQRVCMDHVLRVEKREKAERQDWGTLNNKMVRMIRYYRDMSNMNMIMTALSENEPQPDGTLKTMPMFQGQLQNSIAGYFDIVAHSYVHTVSPGTPEEKKQHLVICQSSDKLVTKDRSGLLPKALPNDFPLMYERALLEEVKEKDKK